jgi:predicted  nucleic acid-binding Zn-ribbon protein
MTAPFVFGAGADYVFKGANPPSLEDQIEELEVSEARLQNKLDGALSQIEFLGEQRDKAQKAERVARDIVKHITAEWKKLRENTSMADVQPLQELKDSNGQLTAQVDRLQHDRQLDATKIDGLYNEIRELGDKLHDKRTELRTADEKLNAAERHLSETKNDNEREVKKLREEHEQLQDTIDKLKADVEHQIATAAHYESNLNRAYAENQDLRDARLAVIKAKDELEAKKLEAELLNQDLRQQWQEDANTMGELRSQLEEIHAASAQSENFQGDIERLTDVLAERYRTIIVKDERIAQLETQLQKELQRNRWAEEAADIPMPMSPYEETSPPRFFPTGESSLAAELDAASDYEMFEEHEELEKHEEHMGFSDIAEVVQYAPVEPRRYDLAIGVKETASYAPVEAAVPRLSVRVSEVGHVLPAEAAVPSLSVSVSEVGRVTPVEVAVPNLTIRVNEIGSLKPIESPVPNLTSSINEVGHVMSIAAAVPKLTVSVNEVGSFFPIETPVPNLAVSVKEIGHVIPVQPVYPNLSVHVKQAGSVAPVEAASPNLSILVNEVGHVTPFEAASPHLSAHVNEVGHVRPVEAVSPNLSVHVDQVGNVVPVEAALPHLAININEVGQVAPVEPASRPASTIDVNETVSIAPIESVSPKLGFALNEVGHVASIEPASPPKLSIDVGETGSVSPMESFSPKLSLAFNEVGHVTSVEPASLPNLRIDVNETASLSPVDSVPPKLTVALNEIASVSPIERTVNTTSASAQTDTQDLTTEILHTTMLETSPIAPLEITTSTTSSQTEASKLCSIVVDAASVAVAPVEAERGPASNATITPITVAHELDPIESPISEPSTTLKVATVSTAVQTSAAPENPVSTATAPLVLAPKHNKITFLQSLFAILMALLTYYCLKLYTENQTWRYANGVGYNYGSGSSYNHNGAFGNGRYLFGVIPLAMDIGGSSWSEQFAKLVSMGISSFEDWAGISYAPHY